MSDRCDAIVLGRGLAAAAAALTVARSGKSVALLTQVRGRKGPSPGGILWGSASPGWTGVPDGGAEPGRALVEQRFAFLAESTLSIDYRDAKWGKAAPGAVTVDAAAIEQAIATAAQAPGVRYDPVHPVERLLRAADGRVTGALISGVEPLDAPITILADGAAEILREPVGPTDGLHPSFLPPGVQRGVSLLGFQSMEIDPETIDRRFLVSRGEAVTLDGILAGAAGDQLAAGFLVTHGSSLTVGVELRPAPPKYRRATPEGARDLLDRFLSHPYIAPLVAGSTAGEFGYVPRPQFSGEIRSLGGPGYLLTGDAAGFTSAVTTFVPELDHSVRSGRAAGETATRSLGAGRDGSRLVQQYRRQLALDGVWKPFRDERWLVERLKWNRRVHREYSQFLREAFHTMMTETGAPKQHARGTAEKARRAAGVRWTDLLRDALAGRP